MRRALTLLLLVGAVAPAHAAAQTHSWLPQAIAIADAHWPDSPCQGHVAVIPADKATVDALVPGAGSVATSFCRVLVNWDAWARYPARQKCRMLEHEFGHLAGYSHAMDPTSVMFPMIFDVTAHSSDCARAFPSSVVAYNATPGWQERAITTFDKFETSLPKPSS
jgi:hypothetical protein